MDAACRVCEGQELHALTAVMDKDFLVGVAISVYQNSGGPGTNWEAFESARGWFGKGYIEVEPYFD